VDDLDRESPDRTGVEQHDDERHERLEREVAFAGRQRRDF
jgi:hypothetical protein